MRDLQKQGFITEEKAVPEQLPEFFYLWSRQEDWAKISVDDILSYKWWDTIQSFESELWKKIRGDNHVFQKKIPAIQ